MHPKHFTVPQWLDSSTGATDTNTEVDLPSLMGGPSTHGQRNKAHKAGRRAGPSARDKHRQKKDGGAAGPRASIKSGSNSSKMERAHASKQQRDAKRQELLEARRRHSAPLVVGLLPLTAAVDAQHVWDGLLAAAAAAGGSSSSSSSSSSSITTIVAQGRHKVRLTLLKPPADREDPLAIVDLAKAADVLLLLLSGSSTAAVVDEAGSSSLAVLRAIGCPTCIAVVSSQHQHQQQQGGSALSAADLMDDDSMMVGPDGAAASAAGAAATSKQSTAGLKERAAAKKRGEKALQQHLPGETKLLAGDNAQDMQQLLRTLADSTPTLPVWRRQRPYMLVQQAAFVPQQQQQQPPQHEGVTGELHLTGYIRAQGLSANQLITVPGAGDFQILRIEAATDPSSQQQQHQQRQKASGGSKGGDLAMEDVAGAVAGGHVLALPNVEQQEQLVRENEADPLAGEQTWPTEEELSAAAANAAAGRRLRKRRLPAGTSEYQAAWILDDDDDQDGSEGSEDDFEDYAMDGEPPTAAPLHAEEHAMEHDELAFDDVHTEAEDTDGLMGYNAMDEDEEAEQDAARRLQEELKQKRLAEAEDAEFPDEVDTPQDVAARVRFAKYRGLKSFRSSPWDAREGLPAEYGRVFAFENFKRTAKRAREAAASCTADPCSVLPGSYVTLVLANVPAAAAQAVLQRTAAATAAAAAADEDDGMADATDAAAAAGRGVCGAAVPLVVFGLLQHEGKLSVLNFGLKKVQSYSESIRNKEELLLVTGLRSFLARPLLSDDGQGADKHKMERFLQPGGSLVGSVYAPISYLPLPLLAFKVVPGSRHVQLAATGALRSVDPDRLVIKKIVLSGYPVRVHKTRAVVRLLFFNPDDVRWFKPLELWTKSGRRGRITEPLGTHGAFKARFDGPISQRDSVCISLYKRVFPKWPAAQAVSAGAWQLAPQEAAAAAGPKSNGSSLGGPPAALDMSTFA